jgi:hypothetical protein
LRLVSASSRRSRAGMRSERGDYCNKAHKC